MNTEPDLTGELASLTAHVEAATEGLATLRLRAPDLHQIVGAVEARLAHRTSELARANAEAASHADQIVDLRIKLGELDDRLAFFRRRLAGLPTTIDEN